MTKQIKFFDTTLRDGEQSPGCSMNLNEKLQMARQLERLNVDIIEAGFAISSQGDFEAVHEVAKMIKNGYLLDCIVPMVQLMSTNYVQQITELWI